MDATVPTLYSNWLDPDLSGAWTRRLTPGGWPHLDVADQCESTSCGVVRQLVLGDQCVTLAPTLFDGAFGDDFIRTAVRAWIEDRRRRLYGVTSRDTEVFVLCRNMVF